MEIYDTDLKRYLSKEEIKGEYYLTGQYDRSYPEPNEYIENLQIDMNNKKIKIWNYLTGKWNITRRFIIESSND